MKKTWPVLLGLLLLAAPAAQAQFTYTTNNGTIAIAGYTGSGGMVTIPSSIDGLPVTSIGPEAFSSLYFTSITVTVPGSVTNIGAYAFEYDYALAGVYFEGNAPSAASTVFFEIIGGATAYYFPGTTGWTAFSATTGASTVELDGITITASPTNGVAPLMVSFTSAGVDSAGHAVGNWNWTFGDGSTSTNQNPSHAYPNVGAFSVALVETNGLGVPTAGAGASITVSIPPTFTVAATANPTNGVEPLTVSFTSAGIDSGGHAITNWNWSFGDGSTSTNQNPSHNYTATGTFSPALMATNVLGDTDTGSTGSIMVSAPTFAFTASPTGGSVPLDVSFTSTNIDSSGHAITNWNWTFGDGATSAAENPSHLYTNSGTFSVALVAGNDLGEAVFGSGPASISALPPPQADFTFTTNNGEITILTYTGSGGAVTIPGSINGLAVTAIASYAFTNENPTSIFVPGSVTSIATYAFAYCSKLTSVCFEGDAPSFGIFSFYYDFALVAAYYLPGAGGWVANVGDAVPNVELSGIAITATPTIGTAPLAVSFSSTNADSAGTAITGWNWNFGDGATSTAQNPSHTYTSNGTFNVVLLGYNNLDALIAGSTAAITASSTASAFDVPFTATPTTGYAPLVVSFAATNVDNFGNPIISWNWDFGDGTTSVLENPSHTYATNGNFTLALIATNNLGDTVTGSGPGSINLPGQFAYTTTNGTITITGYTGVGGEMNIPGSINGLPVTTIGLYAFNEKGLTSVFIPAGLISLQEGAFQYNDSLSVYFEGNAPSADSTVFEFSAATAHYLPGTTGWTAFSVDTGIAATELTGIGIAATPSSGTPPLTVSFTATNADSDGNTISNWNWTFGDGGTSTVQNPSHTYVKSGIFSVALVEQNSAGLPVAEATTSITVSVPSTIAYAAAPANGYVPLTVFFTSPAMDNGGNPISSWNWHFGDGQTSAAQNPIHTYTTTGTFPVTLAAANSTGAILTGYGPASVLVTSEFVYGTSNGTVTITGYTGPAGALTIPSSIDGLPVIGIEQYAFAGGAGLTSVTIPAGVTYIGPGAFQNNFLGSAYFEGDAPTPSAAVFFNSHLKSIYYLPGTTGWGSTFDSVTTVGLTGVTTTVAPPTGLFPLTVSFTATNVDSAGNGIAGWNWNFGDGSTATVQNPSHTYYTAGTFSPLLIATDNNGVPIAGAVVSITVSAQPGIAGISLSGTNLMLNGSNGQSGGTYHVLMSTNLALPLSQWAPVATDVLSAGGNFTITATNTVNRNIPQRFYILQTQ